VPKRQVWDIEGMSDEELRGLVARCNREERRLKAPHAKGRRTWTRLRARVEAELERRGA
jgi:hypothetical protein